MNNSTRNFTNSSNAQNSSSFKDKLRKLTTGVALAGTLMVGNPSCTSCSHEKNIDQEAKTENVEVKAEGKDTLTDEKTAAFTDVQEANRENEGSENDESEYDRAILEMENEQITRDSIKLVEEIKKIDEDAERIAKDRERIAKDRERIAKDRERIAKDAERIAKDAERIAKDRERIAKDWEKIAKNRKNARAEMEALWASVDEEVFKSSKEVQDALDEYFQWAKENWYEPIPHAKYLASLKK